MHKIPEKPPFWHWFHAPTLEKNLKFLTPELPLPTHLWVCYRDLDDPLYITRCLVHFMHHKNEVVYVWSGVTYGSIVMKLISQDCNNRPLPTFSQIGRHLGEWMPIKSIFGSKYRTVHAYRAVSQSEQRKNRSQ